MITLLPLGGIEGSLEAIMLLQGLVTVLVPRVSVAFVKKAIGATFENAPEPEAKPAYRRQLCAFGIGMVAAAGTDLLLQSTRRGEDNSE